MKTLILATVSAAALFAAGVASAQTTGTVEGQLTAAKNTAQAATAGDVVASSYINQLGTGNQATVDQVAGALPAGFNSTTPTETSVILQGWNGVKASNNVANVTQSGGNDASVVMQRNDYPAAGSANNTAAVTQRGANEGAFTYQYGNTNSSSITQYSNNSDTPANYLPNVTAIKSAGDFQQGQNLATSFHGADQTYSHRSEVGAQVVQDETQSSHVTITQSANNDAASVSQWYAERDTVGIDQQAATGNAGDKVATYQSGRDSEISVSQSGQGNSTAVLQVSADQDGAQYGVVGADDSFSNHGFVNQGGTNNTALDLQGGSNNLANTTQTGSSMANQAYVRQVGTYNEAYTTQSNNNALSYVGQSGQNNYASVNQSGNGAISLITQFGNSSNGTRGNSATVSQSYNGDVSKIDQTGQNNTANVNQAGFSDYSLVSQTGTGPATNSAVISQTGDRALSLAYQNGAGNMINVSQHK